VSYPDDGAHVAVGVDIGGTKVLGLAIAAGDPAGMPLGEARRPTPRGRDAVVAAIVAVVDEVIADAGSPPVYAVGIGLPGLVDLTGVLRTGPNLPGVVDLDVDGALGQALGRTVVVDNDANCAAWAEYRRGAARGVDEAVLVTLGTGIGAGVISRGRLLRGAHGMAGEPGHMIVNPTGPRCPCGQRGCWERFASGTGLAFLAREAVNAGRADTVLALAGGDPEAVRGEHLTTAARTGDADALAVMDDFAWWVALGLANLVNLLDPELLVIGGGLVGEADLFLEPTRRAFASLVLGGGHRPEVPIVAARLGERAGAVGAALLAAKSVSESGSVPEGPSR